MEHFKFEDTPNQGYQLATHADFEERIESGADEYEEEYRYKIGEISATDSDINRVPGGWVVRLIADVDSIIFIPFPFKYIKIDEEVQN